MNSCKYGNLVTEKINPEIIEKRRNIKHSVTRMENNRSLSVTRSESKNPMGVRNRRIKIKRMYRTNDNGRNCCVISFLSFGLEGDGDLIE